VEKEHRNEDEWPSRAVEDFSSQKTVNFVHQETQGPERLLSVKQAGRVKQRLEAGFGGGVREALPICRVLISDTTQIRRTLAATGVVRGTNGKTDCGFVWAESMIFKLPLPSPG
jgi:hypothetical protein